MQARSLSRLSARIQESSTLAFLSSIKNNKEIISLAPGAAHLTPPYYVTSKVTDGVRKGFTKYTATAGIAELKEEIVKKLRKENKIDCEQSNILVTNGAKHALYNMMLVTLDPGDEVIIPSPYWTSYPDLVKICRAKPVYAETYHSNLKLDPKTLKKKITKKTRLIILNYPNNPSGVSFSRKELNALLDVIPKRIYIISDEIYEKIVYKGHTFTSLASLSKEHCIITVNGISKSHCLTGWRVGYVCADTKLIKAAANIQSHTTSNVNSLAQYCAVFALKDDSFCKRSMRYYTEAREIAFKYINSAEKLSTVNPDGGIYFLVSIERCLNKKFRGRMIRNSQDFCETLLNNYNVACVPGRAFGTDKHFRLTFAIEKPKLIEGLRRLIEFTENIV